MYIDTFIPQNNPRKKYFYFLRLEIKKVNYREAKTLSKVSSWVEIGTKWYRFKCYIILHLKIYDLGSYILKVLSLSSHLNVLKYTTNLLPGRI